MTSTLAQTTKIQIRAGLSGYCAELIPAMLAAFLASDREFARKRETLTGRVK